MTSLSGVARTLELKILICYQKSYTFTAKVTFNINDNAYILQKKCQALSRLK